MYTYHCKFFSTGFENEKEFYSGLHTLYKALIAAFIYNYRLHHHSNPHHRCPPTNTFIQHIYTYFQYQKKKNGPRCVTSYLVAHCIKPSLPRNNPLATMNKKKGNHLPIEQTGPVNFSIETHTSHTRITDNKPSRGDSVRLLPRRDIIFRSRASLLVVSPYIAALLASHA